MAIDAVPLMPALIAAAASLTLGVLAQQGSRIQRAALKEELDLLATGKLSGEQENELRGVFNARLKRYVRVEYDKKYRRILSAISLLVMAGAIFGVWLYASGVGTFSWQGWILLLVAWVSGTVVLVAPRLLLGKFPKFDANGNPV